MSQKQKNSPVQDNPHMTKIKWFIIIGFIVAGIAIFNYYQDMQARAINNIFSNIVEQLNATDTLASASDDITATPMCFWNWATNNAKPEHINALTESLESAEIENYEVIASAYGEDRICQVGDDEVVSSTFHMMDISPTITLAVDTKTLSDTATLTDYIRTIVTAFDANDTLPKINRIEILFADDSDTVRWIASYNQVTQAISDDLSDDDLFALGQG